MSNSNVTEVFALTHIRTDGTRQFKLAVEMPPRVGSSQNALGRVRDRIRAGHQYRLLVFNQARLGWRVSEPPMRKARLDLEFVFAIRRRRDQMNHIASVKHGVDGLVAAGVIVDDDWDTLSLGTVAQRIEKGCTPYVVMTLTEVE
jgi:hypothetical protein